MDCKRLSAEGVFQAASLILKGQRPSLLRSVPAGTATSRAGPLYVCVRVLVPRVHRLLRQRAVLLLVPSVLVPQVHRLPRERAVLLLVPIVLVP